VIKPEQLREALRIQSESGGHVGAILKRIGACDSRAIAHALIEQVHEARERGKARTIVRRARESRSIGWLHVQARPGLVTALLVLFDLVPVGGATALVWWLLSKHALSPAQQVVVVALAPLCIGAMSAYRLYSVTPPSPPDEIRSSVQALSLVFGACWGVVALMRTGSFAELAHLPWVIGWAISIVVVPTVRGSMRSVFSRRPWWGDPVIVFGAGKVGRAVVTMMQSRPQLGLKPVAILDDDPDKQGTVRAIWGEDDIVIEPVRDMDDDDLESPSVRSALEQFSEVEGVPVVGGLELAPAISQRLGIRTAVLAMPEMDAAALLTLIERFADSYTNVLVIPDLFNLTYFGAPMRYLGGALGIEVQRQLLLRGPRTAKRLMDLVLTSIGLVLILPILVVVGIIIKLDSRGPVFHRQKRLGQDGVRFRALKFRTMFEDAERRLGELLESDPALRVEYDTFHKLTSDPRVTRVGRVLRKYSLDELPQLWNVLVGEMSLVGPRPYLEREIPDMAQKEAIILRVKPGITGIWQVTWRNESTFEQRLDLDVEYVRNWSPWMDLYILARTIPVVVGGTGS
jgi:Undecaprenyl-phosphate galactose phosphotransferase WbaP